jgi:C-terminal processing protease CtpA/Prc
LFGEILEGHVGYLRFGDLLPSNLEALDTNLKTFAEKKVDAVVIDLRAPAAVNDFATASEFAKRFCPKGQPLFSLQKTAAKPERTFVSDRDPVFHGLTTILVDSDTGGAAEAIAGTIRFCEKALLIGQLTAGRAVEYSDLKLPSGKILRVAVAEAVLPEAQHLFPEGLKPDVPVDMPAADKRAVFQQSWEKGMTPFVVENERPHLNEAALISGRNPELDALEEAQRQGRGPEKVTVHDPVVQRALDLLTSIAVFQKR